MTKPQDPSAFAKAAAGKVTTRQQLLEAGGEIFAERGYRAATVREICYRADANLAAISYHFGSKEGLYEAVLQYAYSLAPYQSARARGAASETPPAERLREFIRERLLKIFDQGRPAWHAKLVAREMIDPTPALERLIESEFRPRLNQLEAIVRELVGPKVSSEDVRRAAFSILGQCYFYHHARVVVRRLTGGRIGADSGNVDRLVEHVTRFSLAALGGLGRGHATEARR